MNHQKVIFKSCACTIAILLALVRYCYSQEDHLDKAYAMAKTLYAYAHPATGLSPSHIGSPGYGDLTFLYDSAVNALIYKALNDQKNAEKIMDYIYNKYMFAKSQEDILFDANNILGITKKIEPEDSKEPIYGLLNAIDISSYSASGAGILEYYTTPGPIAFTIMAALHINKEKYLPLAIGLGEVLLYLQDKNGGITDGDRGPQTVNTEPHMDACDVLYMLFEITSDIKWKNAYDKGITWFYNFAYLKGSEKIYQGVTNTIPSEIFATDGYSWTMASKAADAFSSEEIKALTQTMLKNSLVKITFTKPDKSTQTAILVDFSNPETFHIKFVRKGFYPMGSIEWTAGVILALQKNAVRLFDRGDIETAHFYKALAETLTDNCLSCFYNIDKGLLSFYASSQNMPIAPFGYIKNIHKNNIRFSWKTPYFLSQNDQGKITSSGGSPISFWIIFPITGFNPFILDDPYKETYNNIPITEKDLKKAKQYLDKSTKNRTYVNRPIYEKEIIKEVLVEPRYYNMMMWEEINTAYSFKDQGLSELANEHFKKALYWSYRTVHNKIWHKLAAKENILKEKEYHGIIFYPWGKIGTSQTIEYTTIMRFPILNEMGTAMFGAITCLFELNDIKKCQFFIEKLITSFPLHQIPVANINKQTKEPQIIGFWNAIISWERNPSWLEKNPDLQQFFFSVVNEKFKKSFAPETIFLSPLDEAEAHSHNGMLSKKYIISPPGTISQEAPLSKKYYLSDPRTKPSEAKLSNKYANF